MSGFVAGHLMHGVVDGVEVQGLGALGQVGLPGSERRGKTPVFTGIIWLSGCIVKVKAGDHSANIFSTSLVQLLYYSEASSELV